MKWLDNLNSVLNEHTAGKCPCCNSVNTDYRLIENSDGYGYGDIWCNDCKNAFHISRVRISKEAVKISKLPASLKF